MTPQALSEIERALAGMPAATAHRVWAHAVRVQQLHATASELLQLLEHERDLHNPNTPVGQEGYFAAVAGLTADLDATITGLSTAWGRLQGLLLEHPADRVSDGSA